MAGRDLREAIVIGAGIGGLLGAHVASRHFDRVTVIDRDGAPEADRPRALIPQGHHVHVLLRGGLDVIDRFFPGLTGEMREEGVEEVDILGDVAWHQYGRWRARPKSDLSGFPQTRAAFEARLRRAVARSPHITFRQGIEVTGLLFDGPRVRGVKVGEEGAPMEASLVIDASGRGSNVWSWQEAIGIAGPVEDRVHIGLRYATRLFERPPVGSVDFKVLFMTGEAPDLARGGAIMPIEGGLWQVTLASYFGEPSPASEDEFLPFVRTFADPAFHEALSLARPIGKVTPYNFPSMFRRRVEQLTHAPEGLLTLGDAISSFDPAYGQGMSVAALEALALDRALTEHGPRKGLARPYYARVGSIVDQVWTLATTEHFRFSQTRGKRPRGTWLRQRLSDAVMASQGDPEVALAVTRVIQLLDPPSALLRPALTTRLARGWLRRGRESGPRPVRVERGSRLR